MGISLRQDTDITEALQSVDIAYTCSKSVDLAKAEMEEETRSLRAQLSLIESQYKSRIKALEKQESEARDLVFAWLESNPHSDVLEGLYAKACLKGKGEVGVDIAILPQEFLKPDVPRVKACLMAGMEVPGAFLYKSHILEIRKV